MNALGFYKYTLPLEGHLFDELSKSIDFEDVARGRKGNHLVDVSDMGVPIVRTTTKYTQPAHHFSPIHHKVIECIQCTVNPDGQALRLPLSFNNALIEIYDRGYCKMNYHSDQALDLEADTCIALYSCYERPDAQSIQPLRTLKIKHKTSNEETAITLEHNSVVLFSLVTNTQYSHKIVLDQAPPLASAAPDNRWLGITFRKSRTYIQFKHNIPYFTDGSALQLAGEAQQKEFYRLRGQENQHVSFAFPNLNYTISPGDMLEPKR